MRKKELSIFFVFLLLSALCICIVQAQSGSADISETQRDTLLLMAARENPNYDICLVVDVSGSMDVDKLLDQLKLKVERALDFARTGDKIILIRFDHFTRDELMQTLEGPRDLELFKGWVRKLEPTEGFGTDINAAYYKTLKVLDELNEARRIKGEPLRIQHIVFVSDGDNIPPAHSPFRNPGSEKSLELEKLIQKAEREKLINIIPLGMTFTGYRPDIVVHDPDNPPLELPDSELQKFLEQMQNNLKRSPHIGTSAERYPLSDYQFYIDWLSKKIKLTKVSETKGSEKNSRVYTYAVTSEFKSIDLTNLNASAHYTHISGELEGEIVGGTRVLSATVKPSGKGLIEVTVRFPQNWSFKTKETSGSIYLSVRGDMAVEVEEEAAAGSPSARPTQINLSTPDPASQSPPASLTKVVYTYPFTPLEISESITDTIPVEKTLYLYAGLAFFALFILPFLYVYNIFVPITVTVKTDDKARIFKLAHKHKITLGGSGDFPLENSSEEAAEIQRKYRRFVLLEKVPGTIPESFKDKGSNITLKLGDGFALNIGGSYKEFEFLPGNQEYADEKNETPAYDNYDNYDDSHDEEFKF